MKSSLILVLRTMNTTFFCGMTDLYYSTYPKFRYGNRKMLSIQLHLTCGSASTHCVPSFNLIKSIFNMLFLLTHYHASKTNNMVLSSPSLTFFYHGIKLLENLVLHLIQNTQWKQQIQIYFIHEK